MGVYLQCSRNKSLPSSFVYCNGLLLCLHGGVQGTHYTLMDLPVCDEQIEQSHIFVAYFRNEL